VTKCNRSLSGCHVRWSKADKANVSRTISVLILRELKWPGVQSVSYIYMPEPSAHCCTLASSYWWVQSTVCSAWPCFLITQHVHQRIPGPAQYEAITSVEIIAVQANFNCFFYEVVYVSSYLVQHGGTAEVNTIPSVDTVFHHSILFGLFDTCVSQMLFESS
jgi:hypothetical protein